MKSPKLLKFLPWGLYLLPLVLVGYYYLTDVKNEGSFMAQCLLQKTTGFSCMACGGQRALHELLHGNFREAVRLNAFLVLGFPLWMAMYYSWVKQAFSTKKSKLKILEVSTLRIVLVLSVIFMILRNLPYFKGYLT